MYAGTQGSAPSATGFKRRNQRGPHDNSRQSSGGVGLQKKGAVRIGLLIGPDACENSQADVRPCLTSRAPQQGKAVHNKFINRQVTRAAELGDMTMLLDTIGSLAADMNGINLATAFHRVAKLSNARGAHPKLQALKSDQRFVALCDDIFKHISGHSRLRGLGRSEAPGEMPVQCLSIVAWSCATLRISKQELFGQIAAMTAPNLGELKPYELSNLLWAYGKLHIGAPDLFVAAADRIRHRKEGEYKVQCLSTIAWCFATMHLRDAAIFRSIGKELALYPDEAKPQEISTTLWAFAKNRHASAPLFEAFGQAALKNGLIWQFKLQELSNTAWAFATAGLVNIELFEQIEKAVLVKLPDMEPQSIANIMWALAKLQVPLHTDLFPKLLHITVSKQQQFKPQELSAVIWAAAQMCPDYATFFGAIMRTCVKRLTHFSANAIANMVKSLATVQTDEPNLYMAIVEEPRAASTAPAASSLQHTSGLHHGCSVLYLCCSG
jgi:hypothetical protein